MLGNSKKKFINDNIIRGLYNYDLIYRFLMDSDTFISKSLIRNLEILYDRVEKYLIQNVLLLNEKIQNVEYHNRFGWIVRNDKEEAYLGKIIIAESPKINIGRYTYFSGSSEIFGTGQLRIGSFSSLANGLQIFLSNINHPMTFPTTYNLHSNARLIENGLNIDLPNFNNEIEKLNKKRGVVIGNDVWIGRDVFIFNGVKIGDGCIIGAKSVVTKDCEPYGVYVGTSAKLIKYRFNKEVIDQLIEIRWWNWDIETINKNRDFFNTNINNYNKPLRTILK